MDATFWFHGIFHAVAASSYHARGRVPNEAMAPPQSGSLLHRPGEGVCPLNP
jgi:hypothetical protein